MTAEGALRHLGVELARLSEEGLLRTPLDYAAGHPARAGLLILCSNDYLGYAAEPAEFGAGDGLDFAEVPSGAGASRLVSGDHVAHALAERELSSWLGTEAALLFSSGYAANVGVLSALARPSDLIVSDALNHASIIDGCRLSGAAVAVTPHASAAAVERALEASGSARRRWVVTESYFSMDGDSPDLQALRTLCDRHDAALIVDEAHALGVYGPRGAGLCAEVGVRPDVLVGTLGKSIGLQGAFVAGSSILRTYLWNRARSFVFSSGLSPTMAQLVVGRVRRAAADDIGRRRLHQASDALREGLTELGYAVVPGSRGPVIPLLIGRAESAVRLSEQLRDRGVLVQAIRPPTVPANTSRLRVTASAGLAEGDVNAALEAFRAVRG